MRFPGRPDNDRVFGLLCEALTEATCDWYLAEMQAGRKPACCVKCAGGLYRPDTVTTKFRGAEDIVAAPLQGYSCHEIASFDAGVMRAKAILAGASPDEARSLVFVVIDPKGAGRRHATIHTPDGVKDPTRNMVRAK